MVTRDRKVAIIGVPSDLGANIRGACMGPAAIRIAGLKRKIEELGYQTHDFGDLEVPIRDSLSEEIEQQKFLGPIANLCENLRKKTIDALEKDQTPIFIGGDHSIAMGTIAGVSEFYQKKKKKIGVIWVDAHADINLGQTFGD